MRVHQSQSRASSCLINAPIINSYIQFPQSFGFLWYSYRRSYNPYVPTASQTQSPFKVHFIVGNISVCNGCRGRYSKELGSPYDLCIQHEEWRSFTLPGALVHSLGLGTCIIIVMLLVLFLFGRLLCLMVLLSKLDNRHKQLLSNQLI